MSIFNFFKSFLGKDIRPAGIVTINQQIQNICQKEVAIESAISLIANAMSKVEIKTYEDNKEVKGENYYILNVEPNKNQNASQLWHKGIRKMYREGNALIVNINGKLYVADSYNTKEFPIKGNVYTDVRIGNLNLNRTFNTDEVILLELNNANIREFLDGLFNDYDELINIAKKSYGKNAQAKYILDLANIKTGDNEFNEKYMEHIQKQLEAYINSNVAVYPQFKGYKLERDEDSGTNTVPVTDVIQVRDDMIRAVSQAFNIPVSLLNGDTTNVTQMTNLFLTLVIDPLSDMLEEELTRKIYPGYNNFQRGNYIKVDTNNIMHTDIMSVAESVDKLVSCGALNIDDVRELLGFNPLETEFSKTHWMTKNYSTAQDVVNMAEEQKLIENNDESSNDV